MFALICLSPFVVALLLIVPMAISALLFVDDDIETLDKNHHLKK
jgi:hypothetical protein